jgi:hypothetical protein
MKSTQSDCHIIHIGYPKAASTWLHLNLFSRIEGYQLIRHDEVLRAMLRSLRFDADENFYTDAFRSALRDFTQRHGARAAVSEEGLAGPFLTWPGRLPARDPQRDAERLRRVFDNAKIIMVTRRQADWIRSYHALHVREGGTFTLAQLLRPDLPHGVQRELQMLEFDRTFQRYADLFGRDNVIALPMELIAADPAQLITCLEEFLGSRIANPSAQSSSRANPSMSPRGTEVLRRWNRLFRTSPLNPAPWRPVPGAADFGTALITRHIDRLLKRTGPGSRADDRADNEFVDYYRSSNARLQGVCPIDLNRLGYPM